MNGTAFNSKHFNNAYPDGINLQYWNYGKNLIIKRKINTFQLKSSTILDIGCGRGITVDYLRKSGFNCWGCEISSVKPIFHSVANYLYFSTNAFLLPEKFRQKVDTILLLDVIEHIEQPHEFLAECLVKFNNLQNIIITLPARMELWSNYDDHYQHFSRYDKKTLTHLLEGFDFKNINIGYFFHLLYIPLYILSSFNISRNIEMKPPGSSIAIRAHKYLAQCINIEEMIVPKWMIGSSIYAIINK